jgi:hypothetical protein
MGGNKSDAVVTLSILALAIPLAGSRILYHDPLFKSALTCTKLLAW